MTWKKLRPKRKKQRLKKPENISQETKNYPKRSSRFYANKQKEDQNTPFTKPQPVAHKSKTNDKSKKSKKDSRKKNDHTKTSSSYIGVRWSEKDQKWWVAREADGDLHFGGLYKTERQAAKASDSLAKNLNLPDIELNFPKKTSKFVGVRWDSRSGKWHVQRNISNQIFIAGKFEDELDAARASDELVFLHGDAKTHAKLNFKYTSMPSKPKQQSMKMNRRTKRKRVPGHAVNYGQVKSQDAKKSKYFGVRWHRNRWLGELKVEGTKEYVKSGISEETVAAAVLERRRYHEKLGVKFSQAFGEKRTKTEQRLIKRSDKKTTKFEGLFWDHKENKWRVVRKIDGKMFVGGHYEDEVEAALASDRLVKKYASNQAEHKINYPSIPPKVVPMGKPGHPSTPFQIE